MKWLIVNLLLFGMILPAEAHGDRTKNLLPAVGDGGFKLVKVKGGVNLYERWVEIQPGWKTRELKVEFTSEAGVETLLSLLSDASRAHSWMQSVEEFKLVERQGAKAWTTYTRYKVPWPLEDQDVVLKYQLLVVNGMHSVSFQSVAHASHPVKEGVTRMKGVSGSWQLQPQSSGQTKVTYYIITKNKSSMPRWLTDPIIQENLLDTMIAYNAQAKELHAQR